MCVGVCCRKKAVEMELAKCKIDIMSLNSQLLDSIQQKLNLSQQLEAWQVGQRGQEANKEQLFKKLKIETLYM